MASDQYLKTEQLKYLYGQLPAIVRGVFIASSMVAGTLAFAFDAKPILIWYGYMVLMCVVRFVTLKIMQKEGYEKRGVDFWLKVFVLFSGLTGIGTGFVVYYFLDADNYVYSIFLMMTYTAYLSAGILSSSAYMPAFVSYSVASTSLVLLTLIQGDSSVYTVLVVIVCFYYSAVVSFARNTNKLFLENIEWNKEKDSIVEQLQEQKEKAEQAVKAKSNFLASASHDLRQPLHALGLFHDALRNRISDPVNTDIMDKISNSTHAVNDLLNSLLDISKLDASVVENKPESLNLSTMLTSVCAQFNNDAIEKGIKLNVDVQNDIYAYADPVLLERVVRNIVDNAIKYTNKGHVTVSTETLKDGVKLSVKDTGIGIPEDKVESVFLEFNQLNNPERDKSKGLGLGLSIVSRLCELMGLKIELDSVIGEGSEVEIVIPVGEEVQEKAQAQERSVSFVGSTVLFIENDLAVLDAMSLVLESYGFEVSKAVSSKQAMSIASKNKPDLVIADLRLEGNDSGLELIDAIRAYHFEYVPAILVTGDTSPDKIQLTGSADVVVLHKPVEAKELEQTITNVLCE